MDNNIDQEPQAPSRKGLTRGQTFAVVTFAVFAGLAGVAGASPSDAATVATTAGTEFKDTGIEVIKVLVPLAVGLIVAKRAFNMARGWVG